MKSKIVVILISGLIIAVSIVFIVFSILSPIHFIQLTNDNYLDSLLVENITEEQLHLEKKEAFLRSRLKMAEGDSACLSINLIDSIITMEIQGVKLLETKIKKIQATRVFSRYKKQAFIDYFKTPFVIDSDYCTIPKEFFNIKYAPEDTIAAQAPKTMPDTTIKDPVYFTLYLNRELKIDIRQTDTLRTDVYRDYNKKIRNEKLNRIWDHLLRFQVPPYEPWIRIEIPHKDARSIYKAIPHHGQVSVIL